MNRQASIVAALVLTVMAVPSQAREKWEFKTDFTLKGRIFPAAFVNLNRGPRLITFCGEPELGLMWSITANVPADKLGAFNTMSALAVTRASVDGEDEITLTTKGRFLEDKLAYFIPGSTVSGDLTKIIDGFEVAQKTIDLELSMQTQKIKVRFPVRGSTRSIAQLKEACENG